MLGQEHENNKWKFNTHWQQVYNLLAENKNISKALDRRIEELTQKPEKFFKKEMLILNKELYNHNMTILCIKEMMELYNSWSDNKIIAISGHDEKKLINAFLYNTLPMQFSVKDAVYLSIKGDSTFSFPNDFFIQAKAQYPGGEEAALQYFSQRLPLPLGKNERTIDFYLPINEKGEISKPIITNNPTLIPNEEIISAIKSMPTWQPAVSSIDGANMKSDVLFSIPLRKAASLPVYPEGEEAAQDFLEENLTCLALSSYENAIITLTIDEKGSVGNLGRMIISRGSAICHIENMPLWEPAKDEFGRNVPSEIQIPVNLDNIGIFPLFTKDSAEIQLCNHFKDFFCNQKKLHNKICKITFVITKEGLVAEPVNIRIDSIYNNVPIQISESLKEDIKQKIFELPQWETSAITTVGKRKSTFFSIYFRVEEENNEVHVSINNITHQSVDNEMEMPEFPGGMAELLKYLQENIKYPKNCSKNGKVVVEFFVERDGSISNPLILESIDPLLDAEAIRVVKFMPKWKPGKQRIKFRLPVNF